MGDRLADRVVVITGATGDLGPPVAHAFADEGARCALLARDELACIGLAMSLPGATRRHLPLSADLGSAAAASAAAGSVREKLGPASVLLHLVVGTLLLGPEADGLLGRLAVFLLWITAAGLQVYAAAAVARSFRRVR